MDFFALNELIEPLQARVGALEGEARLQALSELAWHIRQRDCGQSASLIEQAENLISELIEQHRAKVTLATESLTSHNYLNYQHYQTRLNLVKAEHCWLFADFERSLQLLQECSQYYQQCSDQTGLGDTHWLLSLLYEDLGNITQRDQYLNASILNYQRAKEPQRYLTAVARQLERASFGNASLVQTQIAELFDNVETSELFTVIDAAEDSKNTACVNAMLASARALVHVITGEPDKAIKFFMQAHHAAMACGHIRQAIATACNSADSFATLGDLEAALEWNELSISIAEKTQWPSMLAFARTQTANVLRMLGRLPDALSMINNALSCQVYYKNSLRYALSLQYKGEILLAMNENAEALRYLSESVDICTKSQQNYFVLRSRRGLANALTRLGQLDAALEVLDQTLSSAIEQRCTDEHIKILCIYAELHRDYSLPFKPEDHSEITAELHKSGITVSPRLYFLLQAYTVACTIKDFVLPIELLDHLSLAYSECGNYQQAFEYAQMALKARDDKRHIDAGNRAIAMQVRQGTERANAEAQYHKQLSQTEAKRSASLLEASKTLETLGIIGREITSSLNAEAVFATLYRHLNRLLDSNCFFIFLIDESKQNLQGVFSIEDGIPLAPVSLPLDHPTSFSARCAREKKEVFVELTNISGHHINFRGKLDTISMIYSPLMIGERLLGVMSIQSVKEHAYGERERSILGSLSSYAAIALDNAAAYSSAAHATLRADQALIDLTMTQSHLIQAEKMASLGQLIASVAHEINTPIAALKASGKNIADALFQTLQKLPRLFQLLNHENQLLFAQLTNYSMPNTASDETRLSANPHLNKTVLSSKEERAIRRSVQQQLEQYGIGDPRLKADIIVQLRAYANLNDYLPLLQHPEHEFIFNSAFNIATIINSTDTINTAVEQVSKIIFALKSYSRFDQSGQFVALNLAQNIDTVLTIYQNKLRHGVELIRNYENIPDIPCLPDEITQVWTNLIHNAIQAMNYQGCLTIQIEQKNNQAVISISDTGSGISVQNQSKVFDAFFTTKPVGEGSGLGLDIVKKIIQKHGGQIDFKTEIGVGTTFSVYLPYPT